MITRVASAVAREPAARIFYDSMTRQWRAFFRCRAVATTVVVARAASCGTQRASPVDARMPTCQSDGADLSPANLSCPEVYDADPSYGPDADPSGSSVLMMSATCHGDDECNVPSAGLLDMLRESHVDDAQSVMNEVINACSVEAVAALSAASRWHYEHCRPLLQSLHEQHLKKVEAALEASQNARHLEAAYGMHRTPAYRVPRVSAAFRSTSVLERHHERIIHRALSVAFSSRSSLSSASTSASASALCCGKCIAKS